MLAIRRRQLIHGQVLEMPPWSYVLRGFILVLLLQAEQIINQCVAFEHGRSHAQVMFARKLAEPGAAQEEAGVDVKEIGPKTEAQGSQKLLNFWVASLPEQSQPEGHQAER